MKIRLASVLAGLLLIARCGPPAYAGDDAWTVESPTTGNPIARNLQPGVVIVLTPLTVETTETFRSVDCPDLVIESFGSTPTVVATVQSCIAQFDAGVALDTGECQNYYTAPIDAAVDHGVRIEQVPAYMRLDILSGAGATQTIQVTCNG